MRIAFLTLGTTGDVQLFLLCEKLGIKLPQIVAIIQIINEP